MEPAAVVPLIAAVLVILALVFYLVSVILELRKITAGLAPCHRGGRGNRQQERAG